MGHIPTGVVVARPLRFNRSSSGERRDTSHESRTVDSRTARNRERAAEIRAPYDLALGPRRSSALSLRSRAIPHWKAQALSVACVTMKTLFTAEATSAGGRSGSIRTPDGLLDITLGNPLEKGSERRGPSPELLFAGAYSACFHSAVIGTAKKLGTPITNSTVQARVSLIEDDLGGYRLAVAIHGQIPGLDHAQAQHLMEEAHKSCPYSKALRGDAAVTLVVN